MSPISITRREAMTLAVSATVAAGAFTSHETKAAAAAVKSVPTPLDRFIRGYMTAMNAPGLALGVTSGQATLHAVEYGYADLAARTPVAAGQLFEIGSISKSFVGVLLLQLQEEGKLDLHRPILHYLPWLAMESSHGEVTVHHLLTHTSGMPGDAPVFPVIPGTRPRQSFAPGTRFHYSNWGYSVLGYLVEKLDGRPWSTALTQRILAPLGMNATVPLITSANRPRLVQSYVPLQDDRPYLRHGALAPAGKLTVTTAAGCIASTAGDMALYMRMLLNRGAGPSSRILSEESFKLFTTPHIAADEFGPGAAYGYGIAIDQQDGHTRLRHTGGMASFMSALQVDMDAGFGAFASINAQLGYRPNPVTQFALQLLRARQERKTVPVPPPFDEADIVSNPEQYAGTYTAPNGRRLEVRATTDRLVLRVGGKDVELQQSGGDEFIADHPAFALFPLVFGRAPKTEEQAAGDGSPGEIIELSYGSDWYAHQRHPQTAAPSSAELRPYVGHYYAESPWSDNVRVVLRRGQLWFNGTVPLTPCGDHLFRIGSEEWSPETAEFFNLVDGKAQALSFSGVQLVRIPEEAV